MEDSKVYVTFFKIPMGTGKEFFEIYRQFWKSPYKLEMVQ